MPKSFRWTAVATLVLVTGTFAMAQKGTPSLADAARAARKNKPAAEQKVWTNDNIGSVPAALATDGDSSTEPKKECDKAKDEKCEATEGAAEETKVKDKAAEADAAKKSPDYRKQLEGLQKQLAELQKQDRQNSQEMQSRSSAAYQDVGVQLRNPQKFQQAQLADQKDAQKLQSAIQETQKKIDDLIEQARKQGINLQ